MDQNSDYSAFRFNKKQFLRPLRWGIQLFFFRLFVGLLELLNVRNTQKFGGFLGNLAYKLCKKERNICKHQLGFCFPDWDENKVDDISQKCFQHIGTSMTEFIAFDKIRQEFDEWITVKNIDIVKEYQNSGRSCFLMLSHYGNWELLSLIFQNNKIPANFITKSYHVDKIDQEITKRRVNEYARELNRHSPDLPKELIRVIKGRKILGMTVDIDTDAKSVFVDFFGRPAMTPVMIAKLSLKYDIPVVTSYGFRKEDGTHEFNFERVYDPLTDSDIEKNEKALTELFNKKLESIIRKRPEFWVWFHRRWRHTPQTRKKMQSSKATPDKP